MPVIDGHQHYWDVRRRFPVGETSWYLGAVAYPWAEADLAGLDRDFLPEDLEPELARAGVDGTVLVNVVHSVGETEWMLGLARSSGTVRGVVGWVDLRQPAELLDATLDRLLALGPLVGLRHLAEFEADPYWLLCAPVVEGLKVLASRNLVFDLLLQPSQLHIVTQLAEEVPDLTFVIDHMAKPAVRDRDLEPWASDLLIAARAPRTFCKLSGLVTEADHASWTTEDLLPFVGVALEAFGPERLIYGSDWPVCTLAASYSQVMDAAVDCVRRTLGGPAPDAEAAIFGGAAVRAYGLAAR